MYFFFNEEAIEDGKYLRDKIYCSFFSFDARNDTDDLNGEAIKDVKYLRMIFSFINDTDLNEKAIEDGEKYYLNLFCKKLDW